MKTTDAVWELRNLGVRTCEMTVGRDDPFTAFCEAERALDPRFLYRVVKVPTGMEDYIWGMGCLGYTLVETQIALVLRKEWYAPPPQAVMLDRGVTVARIVSIAERMKVFAEYEKGIFDTDRISADPAFGCRVAMHRYRCWTEDILERGGSLFEIRNGSRPLACFVTEPREEGVAFAALGGVYPEYKGKGLGFLLLKKHLDSIFENGYSSIVTYNSSNNIEIINLGLTFGYKIENMVNVYVRHVE